MAMMGIRKSLLLLCLTALFSLSAQAQEHVIAVENQDNEMNRAIVKARNSLPTFLHRFRAPKTGDRQFVIKVAIQDKKGVEHFWLSNIKLDRGRFSGTITNEPSLVKSVKYKQRYEFTRDSISDWGFFQNGRAYGYHTLKVLLKRMSPQEADQYRALMGWLQND